MTYVFSPNPSCAVCGAVRRRYIGVRRPRTLSLASVLATDVFQCSDCGLVYPDPLPSPDSEQSAENYSNPDAYFPEPVTEARFAFCRQIVGDLEAHVRRGRLLDIGSGRGELLHVARQAGWDVLGVEPSQVFADHARTVFGLPVLQAYLEAAPVPEQKFDAITLLSVLEQTSEPLRLIRTGIAWLRPGGIMLIETTNQSGLLLRAGDWYYRARGWRRTSRLSPTFPSFQLLGYTPHTMRVLYERAGLSVAAVRCVPNRDPSGNLRHGTAGDRLLGAAMRAVNGISAITGTGAVMTTIARLPEQV